MKFMIASDIHGPRNDLPKEYAPKDVIEQLNARKERIFCVRGNCDTDVDQMVLAFPIMAKYCVLCEKDVLIYATHGHIFNEHALTPLCRGDILLHGHTHVPECAERENYIYMNPGSVAIPKENSWHGYMTLENGLFLWKDFHEKIHMRYEIR